jgi:lipooligosaccharide transport system permease protein
MRSWPDVEMATFVMLPLFLFSATFYPITLYPEPLRTVAELSPLTRSADLLRSLTTGTIWLSIAIDMLYLLAMAGLGLTVASRRLRCQLLR